jgi:hypothetical protein
MKSWLCSILATLIFTGLCFAQSSNGSSSLPDNWRSKVWVYKYIEPRKTFLVQEKKHYTDTVSIKKIHLFKLFVGGDQYVLAFGPFETKIEAANFFEKKQSSIFEDTYKDERVRSGNRLKSWFELDEHGKPIFPNPKPAQVTLKVEKVQVNPVNKKIINDWDIAELSFEERKQTQEVLKELGLYKGPIDGEFGGGTKRAIKKWQSSLHNDQTGKLTVKEHKELLRGEAVDPSISTDAVLTSNQDNEMPPIAIPTQQGTGTDTVKDNDLNAQEFQNIANKITEESNNVLLSEEIIERDNEIKTLKDDILFLRSDLRIEQRTRRDTEQKLSTLYGSPIIELFEFDGKQPGKEVVDLTGIIRLEEDCLPFDYRTTLIGNFSNIDQYVHCFSLTDNSQFEINTKFPLTISETDTKFNISMVLHPSFPTGIKQIIASPSVTTLNLNNCSFDLTFRNSETQSTLTVPLYFFYKDGNFKPQEGDFDEILKSKNLELINNNWKHLAVALNKSKEPSSVCQPENFEFKDINRETTGGKATISRQGELVLHEVKLTSTLDDLTVFLSKNNGIPDTSSGDIIVDKNYPFSTDEKLQNFYFESALKALQKYVQKSDIKFKNLKVYNAKNSDYVKKLSVQLPRKNLSIDHNMIFDGNGADLLNKMPNVAYTLNNKAETDTGLLVIGSFGLREDEICDHSTYNQIIKPRARNAVTIINFIPFDHFQRVGDYEVIEEFPPTLVCPNNDEILLIYPNERGKFAPKIVIEGFYNIINKGLKND